ncbi:T9SS type A sorting domain-containing protein [Ulvibacter litoralis]|uniref:Conserved repeat domain-containing protein/Por secretion system C-terminal sorting domain-containing protein n=1 Tax=Ulvibacter litoralis TaxID=227084 RepID=A0A1G7D1G4_9FLAO|nr:T9SS type A sorting domain-containing protein [Ulvibacter litoralis]GHC45204.1 hypothetical protein GCM10008083_04910 [Ulvibacter litoralis]SDE45442.1 conserved repeat domain-containing protein/Por secretion system C-terminal sorting domain-containing protein [Ulvibacter litoralis]
MKKLLLLLVLVTGFANAQIVNIPDANFKAKLISLGIDTNTDGEIQETEAAAVMPMLNVSSSLIADLEGIQFFTNITSLICNNNQLSTLDVSSNTNLNFVNCSSNDLTSLDVSANVNLTNLLANNNNLTSLSLLNHPNLEDLWVANNDLTSLNISGCTGLKELLCGENELTTLNVSANVLLEDLQCGTNNLSSLDLSANTSLTNLDCGMNSLTSLDLSNNTLLTQIACWNNLFTTLDFTANINLTALYLINNPLLETVFLKNGSDESSNMGAGSWFENWITANNPSLKYVCADQDQVVEIQSFAGLDYPVNSYCTLPPGGDYNTISGTAKYDAAADGCDVIDLNVPYMNFLVDLNGTSTNSTVYTNSQGIYNLYVAQTGTYSLTPNLENPSYFTVSPSPANVGVPVIDNSTTLQDFCVVANGVHPDLEVIISPINFARPGFNARYLLVYKNKGNQTLSGDVLFSYDDTVLDFISATTPPDNQSTGSLTFNFTDLQPFQNGSTIITLNVNGPTETPPVNIGDVLTYNATINPITGDETPNDNIFIYDEIAVGSYDPNNIVCIEGDEVPTLFIGEYLHYAINFENIGTAAAENVVITTEIDATDFDINTLQILNASHTVDVSIIDNQVTFYFQNIQLDTGGHGNILLKMITKGDLTPTDNVEARANIYFDFNFPIETNNAETTFRVLGTNDFDLTETITVVPNPTKDIVFVKGDALIQSITVYDVQGRAVKAKEVSEENAFINLADLNEGVYFLKIKTEEGTQIKRVLKN